MPAEATDQCPESGGQPLALVAASVDGARLAARLAEAWPSADCYVLARYQDAAGPRARGLPAPLSSATAELFGRYRGLVFFLPVGAVVRLIAPCLGDKHSDPAVVAADDGGNFAVSVLSGHCGGNELAEAVGALLGALPVITNALERLGIPALERLGTPFGWKLEASREALLRASAAIANREPLGLYADLGVPNVLPPAAPVRRFFALERLAQLAIDAAVIVSDRSLDEECAARSVVWRPRRLVAGLGCSSGVSADELEGLLRGTLEAAGLAVSGLRCLATLDRKLREPGVLEIASRLELELTGYSSAQLAEVSVPNPSEAVRQAVGTASVAEAAALLAAEGGELLVPKQMSAGGTVAIAQRKGAGCQ